MWGVMLRMVCGDRPMTYVEDSLVCARNTLLNTFLNYGSSMHAVICGVLW